MPRPFRSRRRKQKPEPKNELLERLKEIAAQVGLEVREEKLTREVGYSVRSGLCTVDGVEMVLLDRNRTSEERADALADVLAGRDLDGVYIEPETRQRIGGRAVVADEAAATAPPGS